MAGDTQAKAGYGGNIYIGTASSDLNAIAEIGHWTMSISVDALETPQFNQDRTRIAGKRDASGSFDGAWYANDTDGQKVAQDAALDGTVVYLKLEAESGKYYTLWALITTESIDVAHDGVVTASFDFVSTGKIAVGYTSG